MFYDISIRRALTKRISIPIKMPVLPQQVSETTWLAEQKSARLQQIAMHDTCGQTTRTYSVCLRMQLLFASAGIVAGLWWHDVKPKIERQLAAKNVLEIARVVCERINAHEMYLTFIFTVRYDNESKKPIRFDVEQAPQQGYYWNRQVMTRFSDITLLTNQENTILAQQDKQLQQRSTELKKILQPPQIAQYVDKMHHTNPAFCLFDFWESAVWWQKMLLNEKPEWLFFASEQHVDKEKSVRLLNHLMRVLLQNLWVTGVERAVEILRRLSAEKIALLKRLYIEPMPGSLFASCISTIFMHNKQQHGLNTKHAATQQSHGSADELAPPGSQLPLRSAKPFDVKIFLDMCASCDKREIFEIMLTINKQAHHCHVMPHGDNPVNEDVALPIYCLCETCCILRELANAWQYFDCGACTWLRLEFNRRFYAKVCILLERIILPCPDKVRLVYTSYKNEFTSRDSFVANFVNYYAFYENNEQPLTLDKCYGKMRQMVSTIFLFGHINWTLIEKAAAKGVPCNSISLNQQSLFKSLDNTLYSIFSENSIYRMSKEMKQVTLSVNAPYINRGLGMVPNCGINAYTARIEFIFV